MSKRYSIVYQNHKSNFYALSKGDNHIHVACLVKKDIAVYGEFSSSIILNRCLR